MLFSKVFINRSLLFKITVLTTTYMILGIKASENKDQTAGFILNSRKNNIEQVNNVSSINGSFLEEKYLLHYDDINIIDFQNNDIDYIAILYNDFISDFNLTSDKKYNENLNCYNDFTNLNKKSICIPNYIVMNTIKYFNIKNICSDSVKSIFIEFIEYFFQEYYINVGIIKALKSNSNKYLLELLK